jgi:hypothetical protein
MSSTQPGQRTARELVEEALDGQCGPGWVKRSGSHDRACDRLTAALEARDAEHANERLELKSRLAKAIGALDVAREALRRAKWACTCGKGQCIHVAGRTATKALARIAQLLGEAP